MTTPSQKLASESPAKARPAKPVLTLTEESYLNHCEACDGYCPSCNAITRDGDTEPDAEGYKCPDCYQSTVMGMEEALLAGHLDIEE